MEKNNIGKQMRRDYRLKHGHFPENYRAKINCTVCQIEDLTTHAIIANQAGGNYDAYIDKTAYPQEIKDAVKTIVHDKSH
jgi:hypothetical protein